MLDLIYSLWAPLPLEERDPGLPACLWAVAFPPFLPPSLPPPFPLPKFGRASHFMLGSLPILSGHIQEQEALRSGHFQGHDRKSMSPSSKVANVTIAEQ